MNKRYILRWELWGIVFITLLGTLMHFCYDWSGGSILLAPFCAVNESVWEHLKLAFWPAVIWAIIEYFMFGHDVKNFLLGKTISFYVMPLAITLIFYVYSFLFHGHSLLIHILTFIIAVIIGQFVSYRLITSYRSSCKKQRLAAILLIILIAAFSLFTFFPPKLHLFRDSVTGSYGMPKGQ